MKILQVVPFLSPKFGGSVAVPFELSKALTKRNHEVIIITTDFHFDPQYANDIRGEGIKVIPFPCVANLGHFLYSPSIKKWLEKNLNEFDIIHLHNYRSYQNVAVHNFAMKFGVPYIVQAHGSIPHFFQKQGQKKIFDIVWGNKILKNASICIALNETEMNDYIKVGVDKKHIFIIPNGINTCDYEKLPNKGTFLQILNLSPDEKIILSLGRLNKIKGIDLLINSFSKILAEMSDIKLVIAGPDDGDLPRLKNIVRELKISSHVLFVGPLYGPYKIAAYCDATIFVLPSVYDMFPNTVIESLACGTPVVATSGCQIANIIKEAGIVVDYNIDDLKDAIITLIKDEKLTKSLGKKGRTLICDKFNQNKIIINLEKIYNICITTK